MNYEDDWEYLTRPDIDVYEMEYIEMYHELIRGRNFGAGMDSIIMDAFPIESFDILCRLYKIAPEDEFSTYWCMRTINNHHLQYSGEKQKERQQERQRKSGKGKKPMMMD